VRDARLREKLAGVNGTVVENVVFEKDEGIVVVSVRAWKGARGRCGICQRNCPGYDQGEANPPASRTHRHREPTGIANPPASRTHRHREPTGIANPPASRTHRHRERSCPAGGPPMAPMVWQGGV
jgi:hypothetical protein